MCVKVTIVRCDLVEKLHEGFVCWQRVFSRRRNILCVALFTYRSTSILR